MLALVGGALLSQPQPVQTPPPADAGNPNMADPNMVNPMMGNPMMNGGGDFMKNMQQQMEQAQKMGIMPDANNMNKVRARQRQPPPTTPLLLLVLTTFAPLVSERR